MSDNASQTPKCLFPAYAARQLLKIPLPATDRKSSSSETPETPKNSFDWLTNDSYTTQNADAFQAIRDNSPVDDGVRGKIEDEEEEDRIPPVDIAEIYKQIEAKHSLHKKRKKKLKRDKKSLNRSKSLPTVITEVDRKKIFIEDVHLLPESAFRVDRKPDRNIWVFGAYAPTQVSKYARTFHNALGLDPKIRDRWFDERPSGKKRKQSFQRYHKCRSQLCPDEVVLDLSTTNMEFSGDTCRNLFLPIELGSAKVGLSSTVSTVTMTEIETNPLGVYDKNTNLYFQGKGAESSTQLADQRLSTPYGPLRETQEQYLTRTTIEFNSRLRENPNDVPRWLDFVAFQHAAVNMNQFGPPQTGGQKKMAESALLEKQLTILDRALASNPASVQLLVLKFNLCKDTWEADKLAREWKRVVFVHPNNTWLWKQYLNFYQTTFSLFKVTKYTGIYNKCFATLKQIHAGTFQSHQAMPNIEEDMLDIFSQYCRVLLQSGYHERAIASYQALIEYNFFAPETLTRTTPLENWMAFFEPFWDSGRPRFGDLAAQGWSTTMDNRHIEQSQEVVMIVEQEADESVINSKEPKWQNWMKLEQRRLLRHSLPWRSGSAGQQEDECDDPDRMVLFDDVSPSLFRLQKEDCKFQLVLNFIWLLGVKVELHLDSRCRQFNCHDHRFIDDLSQVLDEKGWHMFRWKFYRCGHVASVFNIDSRIHQTTRNHKEFVDEVFRQSLALFNREPRRSVALLTLWVQHRCLTLESPDSKSGKSQLRDVKRIVKNFLKEPANRNNLILWRIYATLEWMGKNQEEARKIFDVALTTHSQVFGDWSKLGEEERVSVCNMYASYAELELGVAFCRHTDLPETEAWKDACARVTWLLSNLVSDAPPVPYSSANSTTQLTTRILRARRQFQLEMDKLLIAGASRELCERVDLNGDCDISRMMVSWTTCYALFEYVTEGLEKAEAIFSAAILNLEMNDSLSTVLAESSEDIDGYLLKLRNRTNLELLYMHYLQLQVLHGNNVASASISNIRKVLQKALGMFPENEHFNNLFLDIEAKSNIAGRFRNHYNHQLKAGSHPGSTLATFSILAELERQNNIIASIASLPTELTSLVPYVSKATGITNRLHTLFEKIVTHKHLEKCVLVWRLYLKYETMQKNGNGSKSVFYRAIRQCPAAKILYMDAIEYFPGDLQEIHDILTEKEIRVRAPLEEIDLLMEPDTSTIEPNLNA